jgi:hypothetical protein
MSAVQSKRQNCSDNGTAPTSELAVAVDAAQWRSTAMQENMTSMRRSILQPACVQATSKSKITSCASRCFSQPQKGCATEAFHKSNGFSKIAFFCAVLAAGAILQQLYIHHDFYTAVAATSACLPCHSFDFCR